MIHGDIKPGNVLVHVESGNLKPRNDGKESIVIADFGLARNVNDVQDVLEGTPGFASPEQCSGNRHQNSDIYSAGLVIAALLLDKKSFWNGIYQAQKYSNNRNLLKNHPNHYFRKVYELVAKMIKVNCIIMLGLILNC